jgi:hypothetical protein
MLRAYVSPHHNDWDQHLTAVEFAYNNSVQASTGYTPFYLMYGQHPETPLTLQSIPQKGDVKDADTKAFVTRITNDLEAAKKNVLAAQERQAKYYNQGRREHEFHIGDKVLLSIKFTDCLPTAVASVAGATPKLSARGWGPFEVLEVINDVAIRLKLPPKWKMHPVVHASYLIPWKTSDQFPDRDPPPPDPEVIDGEEHFHAEAFRNHRMYQKKFQYYVKWTGYGEEDNTWEFFDNLKEDLSPDALAHLVQKYQEDRQLDEQLKPKHQPTRSSRKHK